MYIFNSHHLRYKTSQIYNKTARTVKDQSKATFSIQPLDTYPSFFLLKMWTTNMCIKTSQIIIFWKKIYRYKEAIDGKRWCNQVSTDLSKLTIHLHKNRDSAKTYKIKDHTAAVCIKIFGFLPSAMQMLILDSTR